MIEQPSASPSSVVTPDPWTKLAATTPARLTLGRAGAALPTDQVLTLAMAHAQARDAVHAAFQIAPLVEDLRSLGCDCITVESAAATRDIYLRRPDLGRRLSASSRKQLEHLPSHAADISILIADGLSATSIHENAAPLLRELLGLLKGRPYSLSPIVLARHGRVALGDEVGEMIGSKLIVVLIGERPGLSAADSLGAYLTMAPRIGRTDAERNCVSNIRPNGLPAARAAVRIAWLIERAFTLSLTGLALKDESDGRLAVARAIGIET